MKFHSQHHSFDIHLAAEYGVHEAIIIHHFQHWIRINKAASRNQHEGRTWSYQSKQSIANHFPYFTERQIRTVLDNLLEKKVLIKGCFNKAPMDKTLWYAFQDEEMFIGSFRSDLEVHRPTDPSNEKPDPSEQYQILNPTNTKANMHDACAREAEKKEHASAGKVNGTDVGTFQEKVDFLKSVEFPDSSRISQRNLETWTRNYSLWRMKKAVSLFRRMLELGKEIENPEGLFFTLLRDPATESTRQVENNRQDIYKLIDQSGYEDWFIDGDYVVNSVSKKEFKLSLDKQLIINEITRGS